MNAEPAVTVEELARYLGRLIAAGGGNYAVRTFVWNDGASDVIDVFLNEGTESVDLYYR